MPAYLLILFVVLAAFVSTLILGEWLVRRRQQRDTGRPDDHWPVI